MALNIFTHQWCLNDHLQSQACSYIFDSTTWMFTGISKLTSKAEWFIFHHTHSINLLLFQYFPSIQLLTPKTWESSFAHHSFNNHTGFITSSILSSNSSQIGQFEAIYSLSRHPRLLSSLAWNTSWTALLLTGLPISTFVFFQSVPHTTVQSDQVTCLEPLIASHCI